MLRPSNSSPTPLWYCYFKLSSSSRAYSDVSVVTSTILASVNDFHLVKTYASIIQIEMLTNVNTHLHLVLLLFSPCQVQTIS